MKKRAEKAGFKPGVTVKVIYVPMNKAGRRHRQEQMALIRRMMVRAAVTCVEMVIIAAAAVLTAGLLLGLVEYAPPRVQHIAIIAAAAMVALYLAEKFFIQK